MLRYTSNISQALVPDSRRLLAITPIALRRLSTATPNPPPSEAEQTLPPPPPKRPGFIRRMFSIQGRVDRVLSPFIADEGLRGSAARLTSYGIMAVLGTTVLSTAGVDTTPLLTGLGIGSVAAGLAVKDTAQSLVAAVGLQLKRPFVKGDTITLPKENITGRVHSVDMSYVYLEREERDPNTGHVRISTVLIPTSLVAISHLVVHNRTAADVMRGK
eukprot:comp21653_c1_seq1/m.30439 comp21653_c1_seq1/g.30439  ORF comp21653_c1_seq1/g.30439 comp21653_c1_seq1/m.30439 type:complete len:216 (-) comp21653_c1_seq1:428-1075(-)